MANPLFEARMSSVGNPDYAQYAPVSEPCTLSAPTLPELLAKIEAYRDDNDLGGGNWVDPKIVCGTRIIGWVSYNGRLWDRSNSETAVEILPSSVVVSQPPVLQPVKGDLWNIEQVLGRTKAAAKARLEYLDGSESGDRDWRREVGALLARRGPLYTLKEIESIMAVFSPTGHQDCVMQNPEDFTRIEVWQAEQYEKNWNRLWAKFLKLRDRVSPPVGAGTPVK